MGSSVDKSGVAGDVLEHSATSVGPAQSLPVDRDSELRSALRPPLSSTRATGSDHSDRNDEARPSSFLRESQPEVGSKVAPTGTSVSKFGNGFQLGWHERNQSQHYSEDTPSARAMLPPPVRENVAEAAELLGTETDVEDDANLTPTKTDL